MSQKFEEYLQKFPSARIDKTMLDELLREMDQAIPEIMETIRKRQKRAAELRIDWLRSPIIENRR